MLLPGLDYGAGSRYPGSHSNSHAHSFAYLDGNAHFYSVPHTDPITILHRYPADGYTNHHIVAHYFLYLDATAFSHRHRDAPASAATAIQYPAAAADLYAAAAAQ